jgi:hypothetical protein
MGSSTSRLVLLALWLLLLTAGGCGTNNDCSMLGAKRCSSDTNVPHPHGNSVWEFCTEGFGQPSGMNSGFWFPESCNALGDGSGPDNCQNQSARCWDGLCYC